MSRHFERSDLRGMFHAGSIVPLSAIARRASFAHYRILAMPLDHSSTGHVLKSIRIRLIAEAGQRSADERQELVLSALAAALVVNHSVSPAWTVQAVPGADALLYELTPLPDQPVSVDEALAMAHALRGQPRIAEAEPIFAAANGRPPDPA